MNQSDDSEMIDGGDDEEETYTFVIYVFVCCLFTLLNEIIHNKILYSQVIECL